MLIAGVVVIPASAETAAETVTREISVFDLSKAELGSLTEYPLNTAEFVAENRYAQYNGTKEVVANAQGDKVLKLDLNSTTFTRKGTEVDRILQGGYAPVYSVKFDIPDDYAQYVQSIKIKFNKQSGAYIPYNFGLTDGTYYSKRNDNGVYMTEGVTGEVVAEYTPAQLAKVGSWNAGAWSSYSSATKWDNSFTGLFLWMSAYVPEGLEDAGYITIEDVTVTMTATADILDAYPVTEKVNLWDLSENPLGSVGTVNYANGVSDNGYTGPREIVDSANTDKKALRFDLTNTTFAGSVLEFKPLQGDVNVDGFLNLKDLVRYKKYIVSYEGATIDEEVAEFNGEEGYNAGDLIGLQEAILAEVFA